MVHEADERRLQHGQTGQRDQGQRGGQPDRTAGAGDSGQRQQEAERIGGARNTQGNLGTTQREWTGQDYAANSDDGLS